MRASADRNFSPQPAAFVRRPVIGYLQAMRRDPLGFFSEMAKRGGDVIPLRIGLETIQLIVHPDHLKHVFQDNRDNYVRSKYYRHLFPFLGKGLFSLEGPEWKTQRANSQPAFSGPNLVNMVAEMAAGIHGGVARLRQAAQDGRVVDFSKEAFRLKLDIVMRALFSTRFEPGDFETVLESLTVILREIDRRVWAIATLPAWLPTRRNRTLSSALAQLDRIIDAIVENRLEDSDERGDLLDRLIAAEKAAGWTEKSAASIRDQMVSLIVAGHETSANALSWLVYELAARPGIVQRLRQEASQVLADGLSFQTFQRLAYAQQVFKEILRLYPPLWTFSRQALAPDALGGTRLAKGAIVMISPYILHRHPRFWEDPLRFEPERFSPEQEERRHRFLYLPFGAGPHLCLGSRFAMLEGVLALASFVQAFDFDLVEKTGVAPEPMTTLRPSRPVWVKIRAVASAKPLAA
ncbi:MAG TPA: cytochrome P450 [Sphingomonadales bacterium]|nr:cytochrome P450 [Sphingomonadales bacterium]